MTAAPQQLAQLQRWLQRVITHPGGISAGVAEGGSLPTPDASAAATSGKAALEQVILPSARRTSEQRLNVYHQAYFARLIGCLEEQFPAVESVIGESLFRQFAAGYLEQHPPDQYTLARLADHFAEFLDRTRPPQSPAAGAPDGTQFVVDLARLEWHIDQVFDGPGVEQQPTLDASQLQSIRPEDWPAACLTPAPCLRLLEFATPVSRWYTEFRAGRDAAIPPGEPSYLALSRREYVVQRHELSQAQYALLSRLVAGETIGAAINNHLAATDDDDIDQLAASLQNWFSQWAAAGYFLRVELPTD